MDDVTSVLSNRHVRNGREEKTGRELLGEQVKKTEGGWCMERQPLKDHMPRQHERRERHRLTPQTCAGKAGILLPVGWDSAVPW